MSRTQVYPGDRIEGGFTVRNNGGRDWRPQRLGISVSGSAYLDFGWRAGLIIRAGESYTFQGAIPNAPDTPGTFTVSVSWQDGGNWRSLGGNNSFKILQRTPPLPPTSQSSASRSSSSAQSQYQSAQSSSQQSTSPVILSDFGPPKTSGASAQLTDEAIAKAREIFTPENYK